LPAQNCRQGWQAGEADYPDVVQRLNMDYIRSHPMPPLPGNPAVNYATQIKPISYLKSHAAEIVKTLTESREPLLITQNGEAKMVVMDIKSWEEYEETLSLLKILAMGNKQIETGQFRSANEVFADLDQEDRQ
jgi:prevent-host-death family protein